MKFYYVKRLKDGVDYGTIDIPEADLASTLKRNPQWRIVGDSEPSHVEVSVPKVPNKIECPLCGKEFKNQAGLTKHKATH